MDTATIEVDKNLRRAYKLAAVEMDTTMRALTEEALRAYLPRLEKRRARK
jgi:predicted transcriptional regulator